MQLRDELPSRKETLPQPSAAIVFLQPIRDELNRDIERFLKAGGKIHSITKSVDAIVEPVPALVAPPTARNCARKHANLPVTMVPYSNRALTKSEHGQNIRMRAKSKTYWVQVGPIELGRTEAWTKEKAIAERDKFRKTSGLPPAEY